MKKLNGWYRIGVVLSVLWLVVTNVGGTLFVSNSIIEDTRLGHEFLCVEQAYRQPVDQKGPAWRQCDADREKLSNSIWASVWWQTPVISVLTVAVGWALVLGA
jgi:hypothetical protein